MPPETADLPAPSRLPDRPDLPDPFERFDGGTVDSPGAWDARRAELRRLFRHYVYGYAPDPPALETTVERTPGVLGGAASLTEVTISFADLPADAPTITLALCLPADRDGAAVPVVLGLNAAGNHAVVPDEAVSIPPAAGKFGVDRRGARSEPWCVEYVIERGYGLATYHSADVDPDRDDFTDGVHPYYDDTLSGPPGTEWGTLAAWAWGLQRCVDYLRTDDAVRADEIAVLGHSRNGKAALLAGATDDRIGLVVPHQSGTGGTTLARANDQETVGDITGGFPHWFADAFAAFAGRPERLPVDQHLLVALVAPRPLLDTQGERDDWTNPDRALDAIHAAAPVYEFLGETGIAGEAVLSGDDAITPETVGRLQQYRRDTEHTLNRGYWRAILDFADVHFDGADHAAGE